MSVKLTDKDKFEEVYLNYYPLLLVYGKTITRKEELVEDAIQELFLKLWQKKDHLFIQSSLDTYLFVAFRNNLVRKIKEDKQSGPEMEPVSKDALNTLLERERNLQQLIENLPPRQKEVIFLRYYQGKSFYEISEILGISYQVARNFSYRAIKFLKRHKKMLYFLLLACYL